MMDGSRCRSRIVSFLVLVVWSAAAGAPLGAGENARGHAPQAAEPPNRKPVFEVCALYAPGHFGNSYEVMGDREMQSLLAEAKFWGFNRYGDWFDMDDCSDPFAHPDHNKLGNVMWERKKSHFRLAQAAGFPCDLIITPNHVYVDQCSPELAAKKSPRIFGQLICPSKPKARAIILKDYDNLFADLARSGVRLSALVACPYDFGGCACDACKPWILTYARLTREIYERAKKYHPGIEMQMVGWWWTAEEHRLFADWADRQAPGWVKRMYLHIPYGATDVADVRLPKGCRRSAFVHIGYAEQASPRDVYGHLGPVIAADRLQRTVQALRAHGCTGVMAYSEGVFDDVNKAILAGLSSGKFATSDEVLRAYAARYFAASPKQAEQWARWLTAWGKPFDVDVGHVSNVPPPVGWASVPIPTPTSVPTSVPTSTPTSVPTPIRTSAPPSVPAECGSGRSPNLSTLETCSPNDWRRRQWELKVELFRLNAAIMRQHGWTPQRLADVEEFWTVQEEIQRGLWGLAPLRHSFDRRYTPVPWYADWAKHEAQTAASTAKEQ